MTAYMASFHTTARDKRRDRVTQAVTQFFPTIEAATNWGEANSPHFSVYQFHEGIGWWAVNCPLPGTAP
jgi:hypothetical protein